MVDLAHASTPSLLGTACFVVNLFGIASWLALQKLVLNRNVPYLPLVALTYVIGAVLVAATTLVAFAPTADVWRLSLSAALALGYSIVFASAFCYWLIAWASQHLDPSYVSLCARRSPSLHCISPTASPLLRGPLDCFHRDSSG